MQISPHHRLVSAESFTECRNCPQQRRVGILELASLFQELFVVAETSDLNDGFEYFCRAGEVDNEIHEHVVSNVVEVGVQVLLRDLCNAELEDQAFVESAAVFIDVIVVVHETEKLIHGIGIVFVELDDVLFAFLRGRSVGVVMWDLLPTGGCKRAVSPNIAPEKHDTDSIARDLLQIAIRVRTTS